MFILACAFSSFFLYIAGAPTLLFNVFNFEPNQFYILFIPVVTSIMVGAAVSHQLINHFSNRQMIHFFLSMMLIIAMINLSLSYLLADSVASLLIPLVFYSFSLSTILPIFSIMIINCFPQNRGAASAMQSFIQMGFNGIFVSFIVALLGASTRNFAVAQMVLISIAFILWMIDNRVLHKNISIK